jgi:hypothetical protein
MPYFERIEIKPDKRKLIIALDRQNYEPLHVFSAVFVYADYLMQRGHSVTLVSGRSQWLYADNADEKCDENLFLWRDFCDSPFGRAHLDFIKSLRGQRYGARKLYKMFKNSIYATNEYIYANEYVSQLREESIGNDEFMAEIAQFLLRFDNYERHVCEYCYNKHPCDCDHKSDYLDSVETSDC